jgi:hypothetical protein
MRVLGPGSGGLVVPAIEAQRQRRPGSDHAGKDRPGHAVDGHDGGRSRSRRQQGHRFLDGAAPWRQLDVDLADVLDWLAADPDTQSILVQFDEVSGGRKFMSAARSAARNKPVSPSARPDGGRHAVAPFAPPTTSTRRPCAAPAGSHRYARRSVRSHRGDGAGAPAARRTPDHPGQRSRPRADCRRHAAALRRPAGHLSRDTVKRLEELLQTRSSLSQSAGACRRMSRPRTGRSAGSPCSPTAIPTNVLTVCSPSPFAPSADVATAICEVSRHSRAQRLHLLGRRRGNARGATDRGGARVLSHDSPEKAIAVFLGSRQLPAQSPLADADAAVAGGEVSRRTPTPPAACSEKRLPPARSAVGAPGAASVAGLRLGCRRVAAGRQHRQGDPAMPMKSAIRSISGWCLPMAPSFRRAFPGLRSPAEIHRGARSAQPCARHSTRAVGSAAIECDRARPQWRPCTANWGGRRSGVRSGDLPRPGIGQPAIAAGRLVVALPPLNLMLARDLVARSRFADGSRRRAKRAAERREQCAGSLVATAHGPR